MRIRLSFLHLLTALNLNKKIALPLTTISIAGILILSSVGYCAPIQFKTRMNPWTRKNDYVVDVAGNGIVSGNVTENTIPKGNSAGNLVDSTITDDGTDVDFADENLITTGNITLDSDANKFFLGEDQDMEVYHDGSHGYIDTDTGYLKLESADSIELNPLYGKVHILDAGTTGFEIRSDVSADQFTLGSYDATGNQVVITNNDNQDLQHSG